MSWWSHGSLRGSNVRSYSRQRDAPLPGPSAVSSVCRGSLDGFVRRRAMLERIGPGRRADPGSYGEDHDGCSVPKNGIRSLVRQPLVIVRRQTWSDLNRWRLIIESIDYMLGRYPSSSPRAGRLGSGAARHPPSPPGRKGRGAHPSCGGPLHTSEETRAYLAVLVRWRSACRSGPVSHVFARPWGLKQRSGEE